MNKNLASRLKELQKARGDVAAFKDHNDFLKWSDNAAPLLRFDKALHEKFLFWSDHVKSAHRMGRDHPEAISESIGVVNQSITALELDTATSDSANESAEIHFPEKLTIKWLYQHAPLSWYAWLFGLLISAFFLGITFSETSLYSSLQTKDKSQIETPNKDKKSKELWAKNWEYLKNERSNRDSRNCSGRPGDLKVYNREPIVSSLESLSLDSEPELNALRKELLEKIKQAPKTTNKECPKLGNFPNVDLLMTSQINSLWNKLKVEIKAKASSAGVDLSFKFDV